MSLYKKFSQTMQSQSVGLDIADHTIEAVELRRVRGDVVIANTSRVLLTKGIIERGEIKDQKELSKAVKKVLSSARPEPIATKSITFGVPESQIYTHFFFLTQKAFADSVKSKKIDILIQKTAQHHIPIEEDNLLVSYKSYKQPGGMVQIFLVAVNKEFVREWTQFFKALAFDTVIFDIEPLATFRGLFPQLPQEPICIVDIGALTTHVAIFDKDGLRHSYTINSAGELLTQNIADAYKISWEEAEEKKKKVGLSQKKEKIFDVINETLEPIMTNIQETITFFEKKNDTTIKEVLLVGGSSRLQGIVEQVTPLLKVPVRLGRVPGQAQSGDGSLDFHTEAIGLALRGIERHWRQRDPVFTLKDEGKISEETDTVAKTDWKKKLFKL